MGNLCCSSVNKPNFKSRSWSWRKLIAWSMIDFSNSIVLMIILGTYSAFLDNYIFPNKGEATLMVRNLNIISSVLLIVLSPPLGAIVDSMYIRVPLLGISTLIYAVGSMMCYGVREKGSDYKLASAAYFLSNFFFRITETIAGAFMPSLCNDRDVGFVSGFGYFVGFVSGVIILLIFNELTKTVIVNGQEDVARNIENRATAMLLLGIIEILSVVPSVLVLDNGKPPGVKRKWSWKIIGNSFVEVGLQFKTAFTLNVNTTLILICYLLLSISVQSVAAYGGVVLTKQLMLNGGNIDDLQRTLTVYNAIVAVTSLGYGFLARKVGAKIMTIISYVICILSNFFFMFYKELAEGFHCDPGQFLVWSTQVLKAFSMGPVQALLRGVVGLFADSAHKAQVFGVMESFVLIGCLIGGTAPQKLAERSYVEYSIWGACWTAASAILFVFIPVRKYEKAALALAKSAEYAGKTKDDLCLEGVSPLSAEAPQSPALGNENQIDAAQVEPSSSSHSRHASAPADSSDSASSATSESSSGSSSSSSSSSGSGSSGHGLVEALEEGVAA